MVDELFEVFEDLFDRRKKKKNGKERDGQGARSAPDVALPPIFCLQCGVKNSASQRFCESCGEVLPAAGEEMRCPNCSSVVALTARFCGRCGAKVMPGA